MTQHDWALVLYGVGFVSILFSLIRTYWRVRKIKKETAEPTRIESKKPSDHPKK